MHALMDIDDVARVGQTLFVNNPFEHTARAEWHTECGRSRQSSFHQFLHWLRRARCMCAADSQSFKPSSENSTWLCV
jgi:hypothetical protein